MSAHTVFTIFARQLKFYFDHVSKHANRIQGQTRFNLLCPLRFALTSLL